MISPRSFPVPGAAAAGAAAALVAAVLAASGCGSDESFPPAAEPGVAPKVSTAPAGVVIDFPRGEAEGVAVDPVTGIAAVGTRDPDQLFLVSDPFAPEPKVRMLKPPESPRHMELAKPGGPILTTAERSDDLVEIALPSGELTTVKVGDAPHDATEAANGKIFVGDEGGDTISVVDGDAVEVALPAPEQPGGITANFDGDLIGTIAVAERVLAVHDAETLEKVGQVEAGVGPTHLVAGEDGRFYVTDTQGDAILVFEADPEPRLVDRTTLPGGPYGIAIDNRSGHLWVAKSETNEVVELQLGDLAPKMLRSFPTVQQPNTVAVDPNTGYVYVAGRANGELQIFDPDDPGRGQGKR